MTKTEKSAFGVAYTAASILALLADFANGIFAVVLAGVITHAEIVWWHFLLGIPLAMLPDLDAIPALLRRGRLSASAEHPHDHREGFHYPVLFLVVGIGMILFKPFYGFVFLCATMLHFVNDSYGTGWGVLFLWPFSDRRYKLLGRRVNRLKFMLIESGDWGRLPEEERRLRIFISWGKDEITRYISRWGIDDWVRPYYLRLNWVSGTEYLLFICSLIILVASLWR